MSLPGGGDKSFLGNRKARQDDRLKGIVLNIGIFVWRKKR